MNKRQRMKVAKQLRTDYSACRLALRQQCAIVSPFPPVWAALRRWPWIDPLREEGA